MMKSKTISVMVIMIMVSCMAVTFCTDTSSAQVSDVTVSETGVCTYGVVKEKYTRYYSSGTDQLASDYQKDKTIYAYVPGSEDESKFLKFVETKGAEGDILPSNYLDIQNANIYRFTDSKLTAEYYGYGVESHDGVEVISRGYYAAYKVMADSTFSVDGSSSPLYIKYSYNSHTLSPGDSSMIYVPGSGQYYTLLVLPKFNESAITGPTYVKSTYLCDVAFSVENVYVADGMEGSGALYLAYGLVGICVFFTVVKILWKKQPRWSRKQPNWSKT